MSIVDLQIEIFIIVAIGFILSKVGLFKVDTRKQLTDILINVVLPVAIIKSFMMKVTLETLKATLSILIIAIVVQIAIIIANKYLYTRYDNDRANIMKYSSIVSNAGFMGMPIVESIFGSTGLLYCSIALIPLRVNMWTSGLSLFTQSSGKEATKKVLLHPCIIAIYIGAVMMALVNMNVVLPQFLTGTINAISSCNTFLSMLVIGGLLSEVESLKSLLDKSIYHFSFYRLILFPVVCLIILTLLNVDRMVIGVMVLMVAMPAGSTSAMLAQKYDGNAVYASKVVFVSTLLSLITIPILSLIVI